MTAQPREPEPPETPEIIDRRITGTIRALIAAHNLDAAEAAESLHMTKRTYYRRLHEGGWSATEVALVAHRFGVAVGDIYEGRVMVICGLTAASDGLLEPAGLWTPGDPDRRRWVRRRSDRERFRLIRGEGGDTSGQRSLLVHDAAK